MNRALNLFRNQLFFYTLVPPELGRNPIDEFLFETRRGFCEHYASAFVFLMRAAGVPARVVTGYQGGEINPLGDYMIVRQSEAHAWAEVWLAGQGWVRVDPTGAVSPARIEAGIAAAMPPGEPVPSAVRGDFQLLKQLRFGLDAVANSWNQWVLGYTPDRQSKFLSRVGMPTPTWQNLASMLMVASGIVVLLLAAFILRRLRLRRGSIPSSAVTGPFAANWNAQVLLAMPPKVRATLLCASPSAANPRRSSRGNYSVVHRITLWWRGAGTGTCIPHDGAVFHP